MSGERGGDVHVSERPSCPSWPHAWLIQGRRAGEQVSGLHHFEKESTLQVQLVMNRVGSSSLVTPRRLGVALVVLCVLALVKTFNLGDMHGGGGSRGDAVVPAAQEWAREVGDRLDAQVWSISHLCDPRLLACSLLHDCVYC